MPRQVQPEHLKHGLIFLKERWLDVEPFHASRSSLNLYLARARYPNVLVLVTGGHYNDCPSRQDRHAVEALRSEARALGVPYLHLEAMVNSLGHQVALRVH